MQNLMIVDYDFIFAKKLINKVSKTINNIKIYNFCTNITETLSCIQEKEADIIIMNIELSGIDVLNFIEESNINIYNKSVILLYKDYKYINKIPQEIYNKFVFGTVEHSNDINNIVKLLKNIVAIKESTKNELILENKIKRELKKLNFNFNHIGTKYIIDSIMIIYIEDLEKINLSSIIYPILEKKYSKTANTIKADMTQAIRIMYYECEESVLMDYFGYLDMARPTLKDVITTVNEKI